MFLRFPFAFGLACSLLFGSVTTVHVVDRTDVLGGKSFGSAGPYERVKAKAWFAVDPKLPRNGIINDLRYAPRNAEGLVEFQADIDVIKPRDSAKGNGTALLEISNRGNKGLLAMFNHARRSNDPQSAEEFGDKFLLERGYTLVWVGWQFDVPEKPALIRLYPAVAKGITGIVRAEYVPSKPSTTFLVADREHIPYAAINPDDQALQLTVRVRPDGPRKVVPRDQWRFSDATHVTLPAGFEMGRFYEVVYKAQDPPVVGLGPATVRDFVSFLKYGGGDAVSVLGDQRRFIKRVVGFGSSQSGRFLRTFLYYGFNADEKGRKILDGVWANVAGAGRGSFNHRFAQPSRDGHRMLNSFYPTDIFPFTDTEQTDPETGLTDGLLAKAQQSGVVPKIFYTNTSYEYWGRSASLIHTSLDGRNDVPPGPNTRIYFIAGAQHGSGVFPPVRPGVRNYANTNNYLYAMRAQLVAMNEWLVSGKEPPPSRYPATANRELVPPKELNFPRIPGVKLPFAPQQAWRVDYGPAFRAKGIVSIDPPKVGQVFPTLVPQVDRDGNETSGLRMPELAVPLATMAGWNLRSEDQGASDELANMIGSWIPFAKTKAERVRTNDPRLAIEERYPSKQEFLDRVAAAARALVKEGYLLEVDVQPITDRAAAQWEWVAANMAKP